MTAVPSSALHRAVGLKMDKLLAPLEEGEGGGVDIRYTQEFDDLAEARREDIDEGDRGIWQTSLKKADWKAVLKQGTALLSTRSKDLQVAVWMVQGLVRLHGLKGLAAGLDLLARLVETFWPVLYPRIDEDDPEVRLGPFFWLDSHLTQELMLLEVSEPPEGLRAGIPYQQIIKARQLRQLASNDVRAYEQALSDGDPPPAETEEAMEETSDDFFHQRRDDALVAIEALEVLSARLDEAAGRDAPSFSRLFAVLREIERLFAGILQSRGLLAVSGVDAGGEGEPGADVWDPADAVAADEPGDAGAGGEDVDDHRRAVVVADGGRDVVGDSESDAEAERLAATPAATASRAAGGITSRRMAYQIIDQAAEWLLRNEPHSPAPYLIKRAVSWENLSLRDVLAELLARGGDLETVMELLGMDDSGRPAGGRTRKNGSVLDE